LHDAHIRFGLKAGCNVICEKPLVLNPWNVDAIQEIEIETGKKVFTILQLRLHQAIIDLRDRVLNGPKDKIYDVNLKYMTSRGKWYHRSWKGDLDKSGGIATNIGVHFFDMLTWVFGNIIENKVFSHTDDTASGFLHLEKAKINWLLSIDYNSIPDGIKKQGKRTYRTLQIEGEEIEFSDGFTELHTKSYSEILDGKGYGLLESKRAIEIVSSLRKV
jgi:UDP-N-acetyl-2-amino-2-deoxyglucuronate dehydrogenase